MTPRRRKTDKNPNREAYLQEFCNRQHDELMELRAQNARLRREAAWARNEQTTRPGELTA